VHTSQYAALICSDVREPDEPGVQAWHELSTQDDESLK
jgi:hypothetical protein